MAEPRAGSLLRGAIDVAGARAVRVASSLAFNVLAARWLGVGGYGALSHAVSGSAVAHQLTDLGSGPAVGVGIARGSDGPLDWRVVRRGFLMKTICVAGLVAALLLAPEWGRGLFGGGLVLWGASLGVLTGVVVLTEFVAVGMRKTRALLVLSLLAYTLPVVAAIVALVAIGTVKAVVATWAGMTALALVVVWSIIGRRAERHAPGKSEDMPPIGDFVRTALLLGIANLGAVLLLRAPVIALGALGQHEHAGVLGAGMAIVERAGLIGTAIGLASGPALTRWTEDESGFETAFHAVRAGSEYALWAAAAVMTIAPAIVPWILGPSYEPLRSLLPALAPAVFLLGCFQMTRGLLDFGGWVAPIAGALAVCAAGAVVALDWIGGRLDPQRGALIVSVGFSGVFILTAAASFLRPTGARVRSILSIVARDGIRLVVVGGAVWGARALVPPVGALSDALLTSALAAVAIGATSWRRDLVPVPRLLRRVR